MQLCNRKKLPGGFLQTMRKFNTYLYTEVLRMVLPLLKALVHSCMMLSLIFAKPRMLLLALKLLLLEQGMMSDLCMEWDFKCYRSE